MPNEVFIKFNVSNLAILRLGGEKIATGNRNYIFAQFVFSPTWHGLNKIAVFDKIGLSPVQVPIVDGACRIPNAFMESTGAIHVSVFAGDLRTVNAETIEVIQSGFKAGAPPPPTEPGSVYIQSPDSSVPFIRYVDGFQGFVGGVWVGMGTGEGSGGGTADPPYYKTFTASEWETLGANFRFMVTAMQHGKGLRPVIAEISRDASGYLEEVLVSSQKFINGDIALISNKPFDGRITII